MDELFISARNQIILEEIALDINDFIREILFEPNDDITREALSYLCESYLMEFDEIYSAIAVCDDSNNPPEEVNQGCLSLDLYFIIDQTPYQASFSLVPATDYSYADIRTDFYVRQATKPSAEKLGDPTKISDQPYINFAEMIQTPFSQAYAEMPEALANTLRI